jgi:DNA helicase IV
VFAVDDVKGLEFDAVVVVDPAEIVAEAPRGVNDLYVALTRPTQRLTVVHHGRLPRGLESLT